MEEHAFEERVSQIVRHAVVINLIAPGVGELERTES